MLGDGERISVAFWYRVWLIERRRGALAETSFNSELGSNEGECGLLKRLGMLFVHKVIDHAFLLLIWLCDQL